MQPNDEQLVLLYYGELDAREAEALRARLAAEPELGARFAALSADLDGVPDLPVPERDEFYGRRVWARIDAALEDAPRERVVARWFPALRLAGGLVVVGMVALIAFQLGRHSRPPAENVLVETPVADDGRQARLLQASLVNHFGDAERLLTEIANIETGTVDLEAEKDLA
ncbi:MAG TPA: hypothetical protein VF267_00870, partial [Gammaproteobacteria bacterium]